MKKQISLRRRWLVNTVGIVLALGLVCVTVITAGFAAFQYSDMESNMKNRARSAAVFFADSHQTYDDCYHACITYTKSFVDGDIVELQFVDTTGKVIATSCGDTALRDTVLISEVTEVVSYRDIRPFVGEDPLSSKWVMTVTCPVIYSNGEVIGVLRYIASAEKMNWQIATVALCSLGVLAVVIVVMFLVTNYHIRSVLDPVGEITEKAKRITGGTYGIQIKTKYDDEIGELAKTINEMSSQIATNEKMQTEFISSLSHELRTPLTAITGWSETLLSDESLDADTQRGVKIISREAGRLTEMVVDLLDFTRIQDGRMTLNVEPADIRGEFEDTVFMYSSRLAQDGITLDYMPNDDDVPEIVCDPKRLRQVFLNILDNAAKHGGEGKRVEASIGFEDACVVVRIRDFGPGIPEDEIPLVKRKFYKGSSKARGSGIGLAVCDEIIQMHGGELILSNAEGGGTLVSVKLPAAQ